MNARQFISTGTYALILQNHSKKLLVIGKLGELPLIPGFYVYVGSAFGPGGIAARTRRHLKARKRSHWHIDFLRKECEIIEIWRSYDPQRREHQWAGIFLRNPAMNVPLNKFGATDCGCPSHLFYSKQRPDISLLQNKVAKLYPDHLEICFA